MNNNSINLLQTAIVADFKQRLSGVSVSLYAGEFSGLSASKVRIKTPAVLVDFSQADEVSDTGTEQLDVDCQFTAYVITQTANSTTNRNVNAQELGEQVLRSLPNNRFGLRQISKPTQLKLKPAASPYFIKNSLGVVMVRWNQTLRLGDSVWDGNGVVPTEIWLGIAPEIGIPHIDDYWRIS